MRLPSVVRFVGAVLVLGLASSVGSLASTVVAQKQPITFTAPTTYAWPDSARLLVFSESIPPGEEFEGSSVDRVPDYSGAVAIDRLAQNAYAHRTAKAYEQHRVRYLVLAQSLVDRSVFFATSTGSGSQLRYHTIVEGGGVAIVDLSEAAARENESRQRWREQVQQRFDQHDSGRGDDARARGESAQGDSEAPDASPPADPLRLTLDVEDVDTDWRTDAASTIAFTLRLTTEGDADVPGRVRIRFGAASDGLQSLDADPESDERGRYDAGERLWSPYAGTIVPGDNRRLQLIARVEKGVERLRLTPVVENASSLRQAGVALESPPESDLTWDRPAVWWTVVTYVVGGLTAVVVLATLLWAGMMWFARRKGRATGGEHRRSGGGFSGIPPGELSSQTHATRPQNGFISRLGQLVTRRFMTGRSDEDEPSRSRVTREEVETIVMQRYQQLKDELANAPASMGTVTNVAFEALRERAIQADERAKKAQDEITALRSKVQRLQDEVKDLQNKENGRSAGTNWDPLTPSASARSAHPSGSMPSAVQATPTRTEQEPQGLQAKTAQAFVNWCQQGGGRMNRLGAFQDWLQSRVADAHVETTYWERGGEGTVFTSDAVSGVPFWMVTVDGERLLFPVPQNVHRFHDSYVAFEGTATPQTLTSVRPATLRDSGGATTLDQKGHLSNA